MFNQRQEAKRLGLLDKNGKRGRGNQGYTANKQVPFNKRRRSERDVKYGCAFTIMVELFQYVVDCVLGLKQRCTTDMMQVEAERIRDDSEYVFSYSCWMASEYTCMDFHI